MAFTKTKAQEAAMQLLGADYNRVLLYGGSRCIHGDTKIETSEGKVMVKELFDRGQPFTVLAYDQVNDRFVYTIAEAPFIKGTAKLVKVNLYGGKSFKATKDHRVLRQFWHFKDYVKVEELQPSMSLVGPNYHIDPTNGVEEPVVRSFGMPYVIKSIEKQKNEEVFYDFTVPVYSNYVAEGVVHHNSKQRRSTCS